MPDLPVQIADLRRDYQGAPLDERSVDRDPHRQFEEWFHAAVAAGVPEPNAMTLATVDDRGRPAARIVLLKDHDARGFTFYSNYESRKGRELAARPYAALVFFWVRARAADPHRRRHRAGRRRDRRRVFPEAAAGRRGWRRGRLRKARRCPIAQRSRRVSTRRATTLSRRGRRAASALGRLSLAAGRVRILAGSGVQAARSR